jgi:hypothetical protein
MRRNDQQVAESSLLMPVNEGLTFIHKSGTICAWKRSFDVTGTESQVAKVGQSI